jgi:hypothetical protein
VARYARQGQKRHRGALRTCQVSNNSSSS